MADSGNRWIQRFNNFEKAMEQLSKFIRKSDLNELEEQGLIKAFEYTHELAWKTIKDFLGQQGHRDLYGSKDSTREAFKLGLVTNGDIWMEMIQSRNLTSHTYNEDTASEIVGLILTRYYPEFSSFRETFSKLKNQ